MKKTTMLGALSMLSIVGMIAAPGCGATVEGAAKSYVTNSCAKAFECAPFGAKATFGTQDECEAGLEPVALDLFTLPDIASSADDLQRCADAMGSATCAEYAAGQILPECDILGTRPSGSACATGIQCESGSCSGSSDAKCGTCNIRKAVGETCQVVNEVCAPGAFCSQEGKCVATPTKVGDACPNGVCAGGLYCNNGTCAALLGAGAACESFFQCNYSDGVTCDSTSKKCVQMKVAAVGEACGTDPLTVCAGDASCDTMTNKCVARPKLGEACTVDAIDCAFGSECSDAGKCEEPTYPTCK
ncbi:MAG: hypothetical protein U0441_31675 [Polyangiaceae bacterium]